MTMTQPQCAKEWCHHWNVLATPVSGADHCGTWKFRVLFSQLCTHEPCSSGEPILLTFSVGIFHEILVSVTPNYLSHCIWAFFTDLLKHFLLALSPFKILSLTFIPSWRAWVMVEDLQAFWPNQNDHCCCSLLLPTVLCTQMNSIWLL